MVTRSRLCPLVTAVVGTIAMATLLIHINLSNSNTVVSELGRKLSFSSLVVSSSKSDAPSSTTENDEDSDDSATVVKAEVEKCPDVICKKYLTESEWPYYNDCVNETLHPRLNKRSEGPIVEEDPSPCTFYNGTAKKVATLLVSFPGSGNTWFRGLLQQVTGVCTGSHLCDVDLRRHGFPGEGVIGTSVLIVKSHFPFLTLLDKINQTQEETPVVFLIRNPFNAIVAERTRYLRSRVSEYWNDSHISSDIKESDFGTNSSWATYLTQNTKKWKNMVASWVVNFKGPLLVVKYEDIQADSVAEVLRILKFINYDFDEEFVKKALTQDFSRFQRKKHADFNHFTPEQEQDMIDMLDTLTTMITNRKKEDLLTLEEYKIRP